MQIIDIRLGLQCTGRDLQLKMLQATPAKRTCRFWNRFGTDIYCVWNRPDQHVAGGATVNKNLRRQTVDMRFPKIILRESFLLFNMLLLKWLGGDSMRMFQAKPFLKMFQCSWSGWEGIVWEDVSGGTPHFQYVLLL